MRAATFVLARATPQRGEPALRVLVDANVWIAHQIALTLGRTVSAASGVIKAVTRMQSGRMPVQLVFSHELIDTIGRVLLEKGHDPANVEDLKSSLLDLMRHGPERLDPVLLLAGRDQLAMHDREDAGVLATCFAARADLLVTDNLRDFETKDATRIDTQRVVYPDGSTRQLFAIFHERPDGVSLLVMHPLDVRDWLERGVRPTPEIVRSTYDAR